MYLAEGPFDKDSFQTTGISTSVLSHQAVESATATSVYGMFQLTRHMPDFLPRHSEQ